jgi:acyl carrier protein
MLKPGTPEQIEMAVHQKIATILQERFDDVRTFSGAEKLNATLGLSSLDLAFLVAELEVELGVDPFAKSISITSIRSVDDLVSAYRNAVFGNQKLRVEDGDLSVAKQRASSRQQTRRVRK